MQHLITLLVTQLIVTPMKLAADVAEKTVKVITSIIMAFLVLLLSAVCLFVIDWQIYPVKPALTIFFVIVVMAALFLIKKQSPSLAAIIKVTLISSVLFLSLTAYFPSLKYSLGSRRQHLDNNSFDFKGPGEDIITDIQTELKNKGQEYLDKTKATTDINEKIDFYDQYSQIADRTENRINSIRKKPDKEIKESTTKSSSNPVLNERIVCNIPNNTKVTFKADRPFKIKWRSEEGFVPVDMPAGKSSKYFTWGGAVTIYDSTRKDVKAYY